MVKFHRFRRFCHFLHHVLTLAPILYHNSGCRCPLRVSSGLNLDSLMSSRSASKNAQRPSHSISCYSKVHLQKWLVSLPPSRSRPSRSKKNPEFALFSVDGPHCRSPTAVWRRHDRGLFCHHQAHVVSQAHSLFAPVVLDNTPAALEDFDATLTYIRVLQHLCQKSCLWRVACQTSVPTVNCQNNVPATPRAHTNPEAHTPSESCVAP